MCRRTCDKPVNKMNVFLRDGFISWHSNSQNSCRRAWGKPSKSVISEERSSEHTRSQHIVSGHLLWAWHWARLCGHGRGQHRQGLCSHGTRDPGHLILQHQASFLIQTVSLSSSSETPAKGHSDHILKSTANKWHSPELSKRRPKVMSYCQPPPPLPLSFWKGLGRTMELWEGRKATRVHVVPSGMTSSGHLEE